MDWIKKDLFFLKAFFLHKKRRVFYVVLIFILTLYSLTGILTISTTKTLSYVLSPSGWLNYIIKLPLQLPYRMDSLGIVFFTGTLILFSVYIVVAVQSYLVKTKHIKITSMVGLFTLLGLGCASCGSLVLTSILGVFGAAGILTFLPLHGGEFQIIAFLIALISLHIFIQKALKLTCEI